MKQGKGALGARLRLLAVCTGMPERRKSSRHCMRYTRG
jgi:hypothetical protein